MSSTVLVVMKDSLFLESLTDNLKRLKASVLPAGNKHEALEVCSSHEVDLAFLDIRQPGSDAMQVLARLKKNQPDTEVILLSDPKNVALSMEGMRQGASDDITVPFDIDLLKRKVTNALKRRNSRLKTRKRTLNNVIEGTLVDTAFAQAGEFETVEETQNNSDNPDIRLNEKIKVG